MQEAGFVWAFPAHSSSFMMENTMDFGSNKMAKVTRKCTMISMFRRISMESNSRIFKDKEREVPNFFEKAKFSAALWTSTDRAFKDSILLIVHSWRDVIGH